MHAACLQCRDSCNYNTMSQCLVWSTYWSRTPPWLGPVDTPGRPPSCPRSGQTPPSWTPILPDSTYSRGFSTLKIVLYGGLPPYSTGQYTFRWTFALQDSTHSGGLHTLKIVPVQVESHHTWQYCTHLGGGVVSPITRQNAIRWTTPSWNWALKVLSSENQGGLKLISIDRNCSRLGLLDI